jgi:hypothetical protein
MLALALERVAVGTSKSFASVLGLFSVVAFGAGCAPAADEAIAPGRADALQGGAVDNGHPAVGLLWFDGGGFCTGSLIAPDVVLTAGHCIEDGGSAMIFYTGTGTAQDVFSTTPPPGMVAHPMAAAVAHPDYKPSDEDCPNSTIDIGLVRLATPITDVTPLAWVHAEDVTATGTTCDGVGFGLHDEGALETAAQKRTGTERVTGSAKTSIEVTMGSGIADSGDSGGPLLCGGVIAGATSCHIDGSFPDHQVEQYARVALAAPWIEQQINAWHASHSR